MKTRRKRSVCVGERNGGGVESGEGGANCSTKRKNPAQQRVLKSISHWIIKNNNNNNNKTLDNISAFQSWAVLLAKSVYILPGLSYGCATATNSTVYRTDLILTATCVFKNSDCYSELLDGKWRGICHAHKSLLKCKLANNRDRFISTRKWSAVLCTTSKRFLV